MGECGHWARWGRRMGLRGMGKMGLWGLARSKLHSWASRVEERKRPRRGGREEGWLLGEEEVLGRG